MGIHAYRIVSPEEAVKAVRSGDTVEYGFGAGYPELLDKALAARRDELADVTIRGGLLLCPKLETVESDPEQKTFHYMSVHLGDYERKLSARGLASFVPVMLRSVPVLYQRGDLKVDTAFVPVSRPDGDGFCSLGVSPYCWNTIIRCARTVIFEINEHYPMLQQAEGDARVPLAEADLVVEGEHAPLPERRYRAASEADLAIARHVVSEIPDGACLGLGVGGIPFAVAEMLADSDRKDLGCWTGTISDAFLALWKSGKLTGARKETDRGKATWNLCMGTQELYDWIGEDPQLFRPGELDWVHDPARIASNPDYISINGAVQVDLTGQENGESAGSRQLSGIGGQMDFLEGAFRSKGGKGFLCLASTHTKKDGTKESNIVPFIGGGSTVSAPRTQIQYVATEYGIARLSGKSLRERAEEMIRIAHPDFRDSLAAYADERLR